MALHPTLDYQRLMKVMTFLLAAATLVSAQTDAGTNTGPCGEPVPCNPGERIGDPNDCQIYYECNAAGNGYTQLGCDEHYSFDYRPKKQKCRDTRRVSTSKIKCSPSCEELARLRGEAPPAVNNVESATERKFLNEEKVTTQSATTTTIASTTPTATQKSQESSRSRQEIEVFASGDATTQDKMAPTTQPVNEQTTAAAAPKSTVGAKSTAPPVVVVPSESPKPPYIIVTDAPSDGGVTGGGGTGDVTGSSATSGSSANSIIIGAAVGGVVVIIIIIVVVILLLRKRKFRKEDIEKVENVKYAQAMNETQYRFSTSDTLCIGPTVNLRQTNNNTADSSVDHRKRPAPAAPTSAKDGKKDKGKRRAPPPPNPFTGEIDDIGRPLTDLYEKDSHHSDEEMEMTTFSAKNNSAKPEVETQPVENEPAVTDPLLRNSRSTDSARAVSGETKFDDIPDIDDSEDDYDKTKNPFGSDN